MEPIAGRKEEQYLLKQLLDSNKAEFVAIYGRRRVGKTFLVRKVFETHLVFQMTGIANAKTPQQLANFFAVLKESASGIADEIPKNWFDAFALLRQYLQQLEQSKKVVFFDELPWIDTPRSNFLSALEHFWNAWASAREDIVLVVCGSAVSWMINKLINNRGGLHNRVTKRIRLQPFTLHETEQFFLLNHINMDRYQLLQLYMVLGGVPFYLNEIEQGKSAFQEIDRLAFSKNGLLISEYDNLYRSLFNHAERHMDIIELLARKNSGLSREEIVKRANINDGGVLTNILRELEESGFISKSYPFGKKIRDSVYRLTDQYSLFYLKFIKDQKPGGTDSWLSRIDSPSWRAWSGYAFENVCIRHIDAIKKSLGIGGVYTEVSSWIDKDRSVQIDLLIDRRDHVINLCEAKFTEKPYVLNKAYKEELQRKRLTFMEETKTRKAVLPTLIASAGIQPNMHSIGFIQNVVTADDLFGG